jgi:hypothetical protein
VSAKAAAPKTTTPRSSTPIARVSRVAQEVAHQAQSAVVAGVEAIKTSAATSWSE